MASKVLLDLDFHFSRTSSLALSLSVTLVALTSLDTRSAFLPQSLCIALPPAWDSFSLESHMFCSLICFGHWTREAVVGSPFIKQRPLPHSTSSATFSPLLCFIFLYSSYHHLMSHMFNCLSADSQSLAHKNISILRYRHLVMFTVVSPVRSLAHSSYLITMSWTNEYTNE